MSLEFVLAGALILVVAGFSWCLRWGANWGSTPVERSEEMAGDSFFEGGSAARVVMTRAIQIDAEPEAVWPWLAQMGRGAGWYSIDRLDNGGRTSAEHVVSWIPAPELGDASPIGYLRHLEPVRSLVWWVNGVRFFGSRARLASDFSLTPLGTGSRLVVRMSADAVGALAPVGLLVFRFIDSIMARRQLLGIKARVERGLDLRRRAERLETGARDQYQLYETIYALGERAGVRGKEHAERWRRAAIEDGVLSAAGE